jgi:hypothetical protein
MSEELPSPPVQIVHKHQSSVELRTFVYPENRPSGSAQAITESPTDSRTAEYTSMVSPYMLQIFRFSKETVHIMKLRSMCFLCGRPPPQASMLFVCRQSRVESATTTWYPSRCIVTRHIIVLCRCMTYFKHERATDRRKLCASAACTVKSINVKSAPPNLSFQEDVVCFCNCSYCISR